MVIKLSTAALVVLLIPARLSWAQPAGVIGALQQQISTMKEEQESRKQFTDPSITSTLGLPAPTLILEATREAKRVKGRIGVAYGDLLFSALFSGPIAEGEAERRPLSLRGLEDKATAGFNLGYLFWPVQPDPAAIFEFCKARGHADECDDSLFTGSERREFLDLFNFSPHPVLFGFEASYSRTDFRFATTPSLDNRSETHGGTAVTGSVGIIVSGATMVGGSYQYERFHQAAGGASEVCSPLGSTTSVRCRQVVLGAPGQITNSLVEVELRRFFGNTLAINPKFTRDFENDVSAFRVPVYFLQDRNGGLIGGVEVGWNSDTKSTAVAGFVGASLRLLNVR